MTAVRAAMAHDLDAPAALAAVDAWASGASADERCESDPSAGELVAAVVQESLGVTLL